MTSLPITEPQMRSLLLEALQQGSQLGSRTHLTIAALAVQRHPAPAPPVSSFAMGMPGVGPMRTSRASPLEDHEMVMVDEIFWDLIVEGIIRPGLGRDGQNSGLPFYHFTKRGKEILAGAEPSPFDPWKYLERIKSETKSVDPVIITYLTESLRTFHIGCYLASTVTLGCAAEKAILLLIDAVATSLPAADKSAFLKKVENQFIKTQFDAFHKVLADRIKPQMPKEIKDQLEVDLPGIFSIIRKQRNDAGHPTGDPVEQSAAHSNLYTFPIFLRKVYSLIEWLNGKTI